MTETTEETLRRQASENLHLKNKRLDKFVREAAALRANLNLRKRQQEQRRQKTCMHSK